MKNILLFLTFFILGTGSFLAYHLWQTNFKQEQVVTQVKKQEESFNIANSPQESKIGIIVSMSSDIKWESRVATAPATIITPVPIKQGERLVTGDQGNVVINFEDTGSLSVSPKSDVSFIQTLPADFVVNQTQGNVKYTQTGQTPISVRSYHLLIRLTSGSVEVSIDDKKSEVNLTSIKGEVVTAFNDINNVSTVVTLNTGKMYAFNDGQRTLTESK